jgi:hypothetical protein
MEASPAAYTPVVAVMSSQEELEEYPIRKAGAAVTFRV